MRVAYYNSTDGKIFKIADLHLCSATVEHELMRAIVDAHDILVRRRRETGAVDSIELILWQAIQRYGRER